MFMKEKKEEITELVRQRTQLLPSNTELKKLIEKLMIRFENWKIQAETNPNPRMVHSFKNIISVVDSLTDITETKMQYSYKNLSRQMSILIDCVAKLNIAITDSLMDDDIIDEDEQKNIDQALMNVGRATADLINIAMSAFGERPQD